MREAAVYGLSFMLTGLVIGNAFHQKKQFYPSVVFLTKSNPSIAVSWVLFLYIMYCSVNMLFFIQTKT